MAEIENQTEAATPTRLTKAIAAGDVVVSREVTVFAALGGGIAVLGFVLPISLSRLERAFGDVIAGAGHADTPSAVIGLVMPAIRTSLAIVLLLGSVVSVSAIVATLGQTGLKLKRNAIGLHFGRINPLTGVTNLLSPRHAIDSAQAILKIILVATIVYFVVSQKILSLRAQIRLPVIDLSLTTGHALLSVMAAGVMVQGVIAAADFAWSRRQFATRNQMSQTEVKDEQRELDGDPAVKAKLKALRAQQAKRNLKTAMARATVVVTNPTHYAVALEYQAGQTQAPRVVAKGADHMATKIREMAAELRLPVVANPPLARALFVLEEDAEITPEHYRAVAEVIAYIWKLAERNSKNAPFTQAGM